jgi:hypothetical protein
MPWGSRQPGFSGKVSVERWKVFEEEKSNRRNHQGRNQAASSDFNYNTNETKTM